jgi:hypothetical protein
LNKSLATALLCGAIGFAGTALAQTGAAGSASTDTTAATHTGPGQIDSSASSSIDASKDAGKAKTTGAAKAKAKTAVKAKAKTSANAKTNTSLYGASGSETASLGGSSSEEKPAFLNSVQSKSTPARGLGKAAMARVDANERKITSELNRASAASTGNANASNQASINTGSDQNIQ